MAKDPWTSPEPRRGDFDADLKTIDPRFVEPHEGDPGASLTLVVGVEGEDAKRLEHLAAKRGLELDEIVAELIREAT